MRVEHGRKVVDLVCDDSKSTVAVDAILTGTGRVPNVEGLGLEIAGVDYDTTLGIRVDDFLQTTNPRIYAAGDVCLEHKYTHSADASARIVVQNALFLGRRRLSALTIPWCTYTDPEIAHVGLYVREAREQGIPVKTFTIPMHDVDRAVADGEETGFVKIHVKERTDRILGATIVARHAGEMVNEITLAIVAGIGLRTLAQRHPRVSDPGRSDPEGGGCLQPHAPDADGPIAAAALADVVKPYRGFRTIFPLASYRLCQCSQSEG